MRRAKQDSQAGESPRTSSPIRLPEVKRDGHGRSRTSRWKPSRIRGWATVLGRFRRGGVAKSTRRGSWHSQLASSRRGSEDVLVRPRPQTSLFAPSCELALERLPRRVDLRNVAPVRLLGRLAHETNTQAAFDCKRERASLRPSSRHPRLEERATLPCELRFRRCVATFCHIHTGA